LQPLRVKTKIENCKSSVSYYSLQQNFSNYSFLREGWDIVVCMDSRYRLEGPGIKSLWGGGEIFCTCPDWPSGSPSLLCNGYRVSLPGVKRLGHGVEHSSPPWAEVKGRVELYLYSLSRLSQPVLGWKLPSFLGWQLSPPT